MLDTVNPHGGWQGSLDDIQLGWLDAELRACAGRPVVLFSHHPLQTLINDRRPPGRHGGSSPPNCATCSWPTRA